MIMWQSLNNEEKLSLWKKLRDDIKSENLNNQLLSISSFFSSMPFGSRTIDYYNPYSWPTPWETLFYGKFCTSSISLLIFYTLTLVNIDVTIELLLVEDQNDIYLLPYIDNKFILNYELGQISNYSAVKEKFKILKRYSKKEIKIIK